MEKNKRFDLSSFRMEVKKYFFYKYSIYKSKDFSVENIQVLTENMGSVLTELY